MGKYDDLHAVVQHGRYKDVRGACEACKAEPDELAAAEVFKEAIVNACLRQWSDEEAKALYGEGPDAPTGSELADLADKTLKELFSFHKKRKDFDLLGGVANQFIKQASDDSPVLGQFNHKDILCAFLRQYKRYVGKGYSTIGIEAYKLPLTEDELLDQGILSSQKSVDEYRFSKLGLKWLYDAVTVLKETLTDTFKQLRQFFTLTDAQPQAKPGDMPQSVDEGVEQPAMNVQNPMKGSTPLISELKERMSALVDGQDTNPSGEELLKKAKAENTDSAVKPRKAAVQFSKTVEVREEHNGVQVDKQFERGVAKFDKGRVVKFK